MIPLKYNTRNLVVRWIVTLLIGVAFMAIVAVLMVMLAFVEGLNALAKKTGPEGNVIILRDGATDELFSDILMDANVSTLWNNHPEIVVDDSGRPLASAEVYCIMFQELPPTKPGGPADYRFLQMRGLDDGEMSGKVHGLALKRGKWFERTGNEVVMGEGIARTLGMDVGSTFKPRPELDWKVAGVLDSKGSPFDSEIWGKREDVGYYFGKDNQETRQSFYTSIVVTTKDLPTAQAFSKNLQDRTPVRINAMPERKYYEEMAKINQIFLSAAIFIASIMAIGGMFGLTNTMFAAVSNRIKDIGVLRVLGFRSWQILLSFLLESLLIAAVAGGAGLALGSLVHGVEQSGIMTSGQGAGKLIVFEMVINQTVLSVAIGFIVAMGLLGGLLPAWSAMRLKVLDALR